ncbi:MAG: LSU ribosomal protein L2p (L8e) [Candidatus Berkelbacteria bacterium Licking1014_7]|uniref:Large ribosomal subunit protein uL2 n=1 Tax=Candidatus Berkelbacteria bacterium Licking1014_7 TaxID=2017147 RepID=A0A554LKP1_9BACT|nr:MAG: LSU ribosomal protein L2p (L8e) [Candidatus Berkelbacteria bacterium Licking1014_7]
MIKSYKPYTPSRRAMTVSDFSQITQKKPHKKLLKILKSRAGRDNTGKISVRHKQRGAKKKYRMIDFKQFNFGKKAKVLSIEYDPYRTAFIALIEYENQSKSYILAPQNLKVGDLVVSDQKAPIQTGNRMMLKNIPAGTMIYNLEMQPRSGGKIIRSAGQTGIINSKEGKYAIVKLPSSEIRKFHIECFASIGTLSNDEHSNIVIGKAGRKRHMGFRPTVRGKAMHPAAHPHGGGEGGNPIGLKYPKTPWGKIAIGGKTRKKKKPSSKFIIKRRKTK